MYFTNSKGYKIYYEDTNTDQRPIIFLHAWGSSHHDFDYCFKNMQGYRKIIYDHRGFGLSDKPNENMSLRHLAEDLKELIEFLKLDNLTIVGYSMGGSVLYKYIEIYGTYRLNSIVLCDITPKITNDNEWKLGIMNGKFTKDDLLDSLAWQFDDMKEAYLNMYYDIDPSLKYKSEKALKRLIDMDLEGNSYYSITSMWFSICYEDFRPILKKIDIPTVLFFASPGSMMTPDTVEYLEEKIENTRTYIFENSTHSFVVNKGRTFSKKLEEYLSKL
ncbi:alpha/beta fold hydrolase [Peptostreptococcus equinus]|uniref:Alpha/beta hydrolase n=1 Tax=Peptostreptococcus equinus TaxID=3003601 RepID=A0ABY7JN22_9FIRM|nr:alpha/beta hydrolase [Peptostreptococcus sp. CBA3647]WAW14241.1 alpha/beta hydrolase [Peptostreptococcus sp. CBA3647]